MNDLHWIFCSRLKISVSDQNSQKPKLVESQIEDQYLCLRWGSNPRLSPLSFSRRFSAYQTPKLPRQYRTLKPQGHVSNPPLYPMYLLVKIGVLDDCNYLSV
uniref:Uncharacterized protein n=1 Tax=Cacopsylla melanoneura TaxID=428564 RepID=A0A8D8XWM9_9HEMI